MLFKAGDTFNEKFTVSASIHQKFIELFGDMNSLHTDDAFARENKFTGKVMHGNILNGFVSYFIGMCLPLKEVIIHTQEIQYRQPVYINDELLFTAVVDDVHESVNTVAFSFNFKNTTCKTVAKGKIQIGLLL